LEKIGLISIHDGAKHLIGTWIVSLFIFGVDHKPNLIRSCHVFGVSEIVHVIFNEKSRVPCISLRGFIGYVGLGAVDLGGCCPVFLFFAHI